MKRKPLKFVKKRVPHELAESSLLHAHGEMLRQGATDAEIRAYFDGLYARQRRYDRPLPRESRTLDRGTRVYAPKEMSFEQFVDGFSAAAAEISGQVMDRGEGNALGWLPDFLRGQDDPRLTADARSWMESEEAETILHHFWDHVRSSLELDRTYGHSLQLPGDWIQHSRITRNEAVAADYYICRDRTWESVEAFDYWLNYACRRDPDTGEHIDHPGSGERCEDAFERSYGVRLDAYGWPIGRENFLEMGRQLYVQGLFVPERKPQKPPLQERVRTAVFRGVGRGVQLVRWAIGQRAGLGHYFGDLPSYVKRTEDEAFHEVARGLQRRRYGPRMPREET